MRPLLLALCLCGIALGSFDYPDFAARGDLNLVGAARPAGTAIRLTNAVTASVGGVWREAKEPVSRGFGRC